VNAVYGISLYSGASVDGGGGGGGSGITV